MTKDHKHHEDGAHEKNTHKPKTHTSHKTPHKPEHHSEHSKDVSAKHKETLTYPADDMEAINDSVLDDDGYVKASEVKVLRKGDKVNTEYNQDTMSDSEKNKKATILGRKPSPKKGESIAKLRKKVGFSWERFGRKFLLAGIVFAVIFVVGASIAAAYLIDIWNQTQDVDLTSQPTESSIVYARDGKTVLFEFYGEERREVVPFEQIPRNMQLAIIALEDENYYFNETGIPWSNIAGAALKCLQGNGSECRGGSGLSQQYIKNLTGESEATISRKIRELFTALRLNVEKNKEEILALYLNQVPFGRNAYGVQEASRSYFDKEVQDLETHEACLLASMVQQPSKFDSAVRAQTGDAWEELLGRKNSCLDKMRNLQLGGVASEEFIQSDEELEELKEKELFFTDNIDEYPYPHFRDYVRAELRKFNISEQALYSRGYRITTTIDPAIQQQVEESVSSNYEGAVVANGANNAAAVVLDGPSGEIVALVGSADYDNQDIDGQVNIVTSPQQPGSSIKPYVYLTDFLQGFNPGTVVLDAKMDFGYGGFTPKNFTDRNNGLVTLRNSLQSSYNIPAVKGAFLAAGDTPPEQINTNQEVENLGLTGIDTIIDTTKRLGLEYPFEDNCFVSTAIGGCEVTMLSHATALNTIAQDGNRKTATPFISIIDSKTDEDVYKVVQESEKAVYPKIDQVIDARYARQLSNVLSDSQARYGAFCGGSSRCNLARRLDLIDEGWDGDFKVAAKTGTTDEIRDTWTVGYSPYYTVTTWVGNTTNEPMFRDAVSANSAGVIWKDIMTKVHEGKEKRGFSREGLEEVSIVPSTGLLGGGGTELLTSEQRQILEEARSRLNSNNYDASKNTIFQNRSVVISQTLKVNRLDGKLAVEGKTLPEFIEERTYTQILPEFPVGEWKTTAQAYNRNNARPPTEFSAQDQVSESNNKPRITTNVVSNAQAPGNIVLQAQTTGNNDKTIDLSEIYIDGNLVASDSDGEVLFNTVSVSGGQREVILRATDSFGSTAERKFTNVNFSEEDKGDNEGGGVTIDAPDSTSISNSSITLRATSISDFEPLPKLILKQGVVQRECQAQKNGDSYSCEISTSGFIPTVDDETRATIEFVDNSQLNLTANPRSINLTL